MKPLKTSDFIKQVEALDYTVSRDGYMLLFIKDATNTTVATVDLEEPFRIDTYYTVMPPRALFDLIVAYAATPIDQRQD